MTRNLAQAANWLRKAAEQGCSPAQLRLVGMLGQIGMTVGDDDQTASWLRKAMDYGYVEAGAPEKSWQFPGGSSPGHPAI